MRAPSLLATLALLPTLIQAGAATSSPERVHVGDSLKRLDLLRPGVHRYVRYTIKDGRRSLIDIWSRTVSFEPHEGRRLLHIVQRWDEVSDKDPFFLIQDSWFEPNTFRPLTHIRRRSKDGKETVSAYQFLPDKVIGLPGIPDNTRNDFVVDSPEASYNFEYDMELLQTLPLHTGYIADIPFYDAGFDPPARYLFKVAGSESIAGPDGRALDCWLVTADYNTGKVVSRFWFEKHSQILIREQQVQDDGTILIKTLLNPEPADESQSFRPAG